jgi:fucose permease
MQLDRQSHAEGTPACSSLPGVAIDSRSRRLITLILASFVTLGLPVGLLGTAWPSLRTSVGRPVSDLGVVLAVGTVGYGLATFVSGWAWARFAVGRILVAAMGTGIVSLGAYAAVGSWWVVLVAAVMVGVSGGLMEGALNSYVALHHGVRVMNLMHASFGVGATLGPLLMTAVLATDHSWRWGYWMVAGYEVVVLGVLWRVRTTWRRMEESPKDPGHGPVRRRMVAGLMAIFFVYTGLEIGTGQWAYSFLTEGRGVSEVAAGIWVSVFWGSLTGGRLLLGIIGGRVTPRAVLDLSVTGAFVGLAWLWWNPAGLGMVALAVIGFSFASVYPMFVALTPEKVGTAKAPHVIGYQITAGAVGAAVIPWAAGRIVARYSLAALGPYFLAVGGLLALLHVVIEHTGRVPVRPRPDTTAGVAGAG